MSDGPAPRRLLLVGGGGGFVGRAVLNEFAPSWTVRSVHRRASPDEARFPVERVGADVTAIEDWAPLLNGVDLVVNLAWYRTGPDRRFRPLAAGIERLIRSAERCGVSRFVQVSVPDAPETLERSLPYLARKREVDRALAASALDYVIVRPTMLFGPRDKLLTVMLRTMERYHRFPMFGDGDYHVSPLAIEDLAHLLRVEAERGGRRTISIGGPDRWVYRDLTDRMFAALGRAPRYVHFSNRGSVRLARWLEALGSTRLYAYEVEWLLSDRLGLPPYGDLGRPLAEVGPFLEREAARLRAA
jgi:NADH dehydrogenase